MMNSTVDPSCTTNVSIVIVGPQAKTRPLTPDRKRGFSSHSQAQAPQTHLHMQVPAIASLVQVRGLGGEYPKPETLNQGHACHPGVGTVEDSASELGPVETTETWRVRLPPELLMSPKVRYKNLHFRDFDFG